MPSLTRLRPTGHQYDLLVHGSMTYCPNDYPRHQYYLLVHGSMTCCPNDYPRHQYDLLVHGSMTFCPCRLLVHGIMVYCTNDHQYDLLVQTYCSTLYPYESTAVWLTDLVAATGRLPGAAARFGFHSHLVFV